MTTAPKPICFVIAPIGDEGSEIRDRSDKVLKHIITPAADQCGYQTIRADQISEPGIITSQVIEHLADDPLVIADLTGQNPNVFYELAVRHAIGKPVVQIIQLGERIPFDVAATRTICVDHRDLDSAANCKKQIADQIRAVEKDATQVDTPISIALDLKSLRQSDNPVASTIEQILPLLQEIKTALALLMNRSDRDKSLQRQTTEQLMRSLYPLPYTPTWPDIDLTHEGLEALQRKLNALESLRPPKIQPQESQSQPQEPQGPPPAPEAGPRDTKRDPTT